MEINERHEPTMPRPPAAEIDRVHQDLATVLSDAGHDADGRRAVGQDVLRERLKSVGHSLAAIDWAIHLLCEKGLLRTTILNEKQVRTIRPGVSEAKARTVNVPAVTATEKFWERWQTGTFAPSRHEPSPCWQIQDAVSTDTSLQIPATPAPLALVMKGGGIKGLAYVGALEILARKYEFNWFIGTSAGAIAAILLAAGYSHIELLEILRAKDFRDFFDAEWYQMPSNFLFYKGLHKARSFTDWMDELLANKLKSHQRVRLSDLPNRVTVYASARGTDALKFDSQENGDVHAAYAARCSMSIPFVFVPESNQGMRAWDGGLRHNFPIDKLLEDYPGTKFISLYLGAEIYEPPTSASILEELISILTEARDPKAIEKYRSSTVIIDPRPIGTVDFGLTDSEKELLLAAGRAGALVHLDATTNECAAAIQRRDTLRQSVEDARSAAASKRRRRRWALVVLLGLFAGIATWKLWPRHVPGSTESVQDENVQALPVYDMAPPTVAVRLDDFRSDRGTGFATVRGDPIQFVQEGHARTLYLKVVLRNVGEKSVTLRAVSFQVIEFTPAPGDDPAEDRLSFRVTVTFANTPTPERLREIEKQFRLTLDSVVGALAEFNAHGGIPDSALAQLGRLDGVKSVTFTKVGSGQTEINFAARELIPDLNGNMDAASSAIDIDAEAGRAHGLLAKVTFGRAGVYRLQGEIDYVEKKLPLPDCRVVVTR